MISINRELPPGTHPLTTVFPDIKCVRILSEIFEDPDECDTVLNQTCVHLLDRPYEMSVDNDDGSINIGHRYLRNSEDWMLYIDIIHELVHVRQQRRGMDLFDRSKRYIDRETELEAFEFGLRVAHGLKITNEQLWEYFDLPWISESERHELVQKLGVQIPPDS